MLGNSWYSSNWNQTRFYLSDGALLLLSPFVLSGGVSKLEIKQVTKLANYTVVNYSRKEGASERLNMHATFSFFKIELCFNGYQHTF